MFPYIFYISDNGLFIGLVTKMRLRKLLEDGDIDPVQQSKFYRSVRAFYVRSMEYAIKNLPLKDDLLKNAKFVNFHGRESSSFSEVEYFVERLI